MQLIGLARLGQPTLPLQTDGLLSGWRALRPGAACLVFVYICRRTPLKGPGAYTMGVLTLPV